MFEVEILDNGPNGKIYSFTKESITIGRSIDNDIVIDSLQVSKRHCRLTEYPYYIELEDLGSTNGVLVENQRVKTAQIRSGEQFRLSTSLAPLRVKLHTSAAPVDTHESEPRRAPAERTLDETVVQSPVDLGEKPTETLGEHERERLRSLSERVGPAAPALRPNRELPYQPSESEYATRLTELKKQMEYYADSQVQKAQKEIYGRLIPAGLGGLVLLLVGAYLVVNQATAPLRNLEKRLEIAEYNVKDLKRIIGNAQKSVTEEIARQKEDAMTKMRADMENEKKAFKIQLDAQIKAEKAKAEVDLTQKVDVILKQRAQQYGLQLPNKP